MDIEDLVKKSKEFGLYKVPDPKPIQAQKQILEILNCKPDRCFQTKELNAILKHDGIRTPSSGILTRLVNQGKCEQVKLGVYRAKPHHVCRQSLLEKIKLILQKIF